MLQWHRDEITELPPGAALLAASTRYPHQAFRLGDRAWGLQFHIECDTAMIADWAAATRRCSPSWATTPELVVAACDRVLADVEEVWQPFAARFAALALGELPDADSPTPARPAAARALMTPADRAPAAGSPATASPTTARAAPPTCSARTGCGLWDADDAGAGRRPAAAELLAALSRAADPDLALRQLHRLVEAASRRRAATAARRRSGRGRRARRRCAPTPGCGAG